MVEIALLGLFFGFSAGTEAAQGAAAAALRRLQRPPSGCGRPLGRYSDSTEAKKMA